LPAEPKPKAVAQQFLEALGIVTSCVTPQRLNVSSHAYTPNEPNTAAFIEPVSLRGKPGGPSGLFLDVAHMFMITDTDPSGNKRQWRVTTRMYQYSLLDHDQTDLLVYHWQPGADFGGPDHPHVHVSATLNARVDAITERPIGLHALHVATGRVSLEAIVRMLIDDFHIKPRRVGWRDLLDKTEAVFREEATQQA